MRDKFAVSKIIAIVAILIIAIFVLAIYSLTSQPSSSDTISTSETQSTQNSQPSSSKPLISSTVTYRDLQEDMDAWEGNFKSYNTGDTAIFRDVITSIDFVTGIMDTEWTILCFEAYRLPSRNEFSSGQFSRQSWWVYDSEGYHTPFNIKRASYPVDYLAEGEMGIKGDIRDKVRVGNTIQCTLHFIDWVWADPRYESTDLVETECISELTKSGFGVKSEVIQIFS